MTSERERVASPPKKRKTGTTSQSSPEGSSTKQKASRTSITQSAPGPSTQSSRKAGRRESNGTRSTSSSPKRTRNGRQRESPDAPELGLADSARKRVDGKKSRGETRRHLAPGDDGESPAKQSASAATPDSSASGDSSDAAGDSSDNEDETKIVEPQVIAMLESRIESAAFTKISFDEADPSGSGPIKVGDVVEVARSNIEKGQERKSSAGYLGVVEEIRALKSDIADVVDTATGQPVMRHGKTQKTVRKLYLKVGWFYSKKDFKDTDDSWKAFKQQSSAMGPNERVKSDLTDWDRQSNLILHSRPELMYVFDDAYPAPNASGQTSEHPLDFFSASRLSTLCASKHAEPALTTARATDPAGSARVPIKGRGDLSAHYTIPPFYFGVTSTTSLPPTTRSRRPLAYTHRPPFREELFANGSNIKDGIQDFTYVRTAFSWELQEPIEGSGETISKAETSLWKRIRQDEEDTKPKKLWPLVFNRHSEPPRPYDPLAVQLYSRKSGRWWNISDLQRLQCYRVKGWVEDDNKSQEKQASRQGSGDSKDASARNGTGASVLAQALLAADNSDSEFDDETQLSQRDPRYRQSEIDTVHSSIVELSNASIVRGGAYGLTGNVYLVARAAWLLHHYDGSLESNAPALPCPSDLESAPTPAEWLAESKQVLTDLDVWEDGVEQRQRGEREGNGLKQGWAETGDSTWTKVRKSEAFSPEDPLEWLCPDTREAI